MDAATEISVDWTYQYNTLNQLKKRYDGASWTGADGDARWSYEYDKNGNLTKATKQEKASGTWGEKLRFEYDWNPRDQMERVDKFVNGAGVPQKCWIVNPFSIPPAHESLRASRGVPPLGGKDSSGSCDEKGFTSQECRSAEIVGP